MPDPRAEIPPEDRFPTTRWSRVVAAGDLSDARRADALAELCHGYWYPIYAFIRRKGVDPESALDLTQDYFARLLDGGVIAAADRQKGRFRSFLRTDCAFFLAHRREYEAAEKRGGRVVSLSIDARDAEGRYLREPADPGLTPDRLFDRTWALGVLDLAVGRLAGEQPDPARFEELRPALGGDRSISYSVLAERLGLTELAVQSAVSRLRKRYRVILRDLIAETLDAPTDDAIETEIRELIFALGR